MFGKRRRKRTAITAFSLRWYAIIEETKNLEFTEI